MASPKSEGPSEPFKRALAHAARSLAETPDLEVVFSGETPGLVGCRAVLPHPPRDLSGREASRIRGLADQIALRLAHHDEAAHSRLRPQESEAAAVFEAVEQARIESIGANALGGVRANLRAVLETQVERKGLARMEDRVQAPMADVLGLMVRERLTGEAPPDGARALVDALRPEIEAKAGPDLDRLSGALEDQAAFGRIVRTILNDLDMGEAAPSDSTEQSDEQEPQTEDQPDQGEGEDNDQGVDDSAAMSEASESDAEGAEPQDARSETTDDADLADESPQDSEQNRPARPEVKDPGRPEPAYKVFSIASDEVVDADELCDSEELARLRAYLDQQLSALSSVVARLANRLQRRLMAQQTRAWEFSTSRACLE